MNTGEKIKNTFNDVIAAINTNINDRTDKIIRISLFINN
jgi:hypothetical protein